MRCWFPSPGSSSQSPLNYSQFQITFHPERSHVIRKADDAAESKDPYITQLFAL